MRPDLSIGAVDKESTASISVAYCPERVLPSRILTELVNNDRCIGGITASCARRAQRFYKTFVRGACVATTARTAELVKLTENAFRDTNIAFANELSLICDRHAINVWEVIDLANRHPRVNVLRPGPGVGGHCIAVDPWFIIDSAPDLARLMRTSREVNDHKTASDDRARRRADRRPSIRECRLLRLSLQSERRRSEGEPCNGNCDAPGKEISARVSRSSSPIFVIFLPISRSTEPSS